MSEANQLAEKKDTDNKNFILKTRSILLSGEVDKDSPKKIIPQLLMLESYNEKSPIYVFIDSPGGDVDSGLAIYNTIRFVNCPVYTIGTGLVASIAATIFLSVPSCQRISLPYTRYLLHQPLGGIQGVVTDIEIHTKELERTKEELTKIISEAIKRDYKEVVKQIERDYWITSQQAKDYGLVGHLIQERQELNNILRINKHLN